MITADAERVRKEVNKAIARASRHFDDGREAKVMFTGNAPNQRPQVVWVPLSAADPHPDHITARIRAFHKVTPLQVHPA